MNDLLNLKKQKSNIAQTLLASCLIVFSQLTFAAKPPTKQNPAPPPGEGRRETASVRVEQKGEPTPSGSKRHNFEYPQEKETV